MTRHLLHVTLTSGHVRESPRSEVSDGVIAALRPLLDRALTGEHVAIPGQIGYTMTGGVHGRCCAVTLWLQHSEGGGRPEPVPVVTVGVGAHSRCGAYLWRSLHDHAPDPGLLVTSRDEVPPEPWCADRIDIGMALRPEAAEWTGDWSRCVAWTWLER